MKETVEKAVTSSGVSDDHPLYSLSEKMSSFLLDSKSYNTNRSYYSTFNKWSTFIKEQGFNNLPADPMHVALYITHLIDKQCSPSVIDKVIYSLRWVHEINGYKDPTLNHFVNSLQESAKRLNGKPVNKKDPVTLEIIIEICTRFEKSDDLLVVRDLAMIVLSFAGFLRFDELSSLKCNDVVVQDEFLKLKIVQSKTDQYRQGSEVLISKGKTVACPVDIFKRYVLISGLNLKSEFYIFRPIFRNKGIAKLIYKNKKISYTAARENILKRLKMVAPSLNLGLHSLRSGGASKAAQSSDVNERCIKRHGRWKSDMSKDGYIEDTFEKRLSVSQSLGL